jgi:hypothetical protein
MKTMAGAVAVAALFATAGCNKNSTAAATTTAASATTRTTDTFTGTVPVAGDDFHSFPISETGQIDVTLTAAGPPSSIVMGLMVGMPSDSKCVALAGASTTAQGAASPQLSGEASAGTLCVDVRDVGNQTAPVTYTVTVAHP